MLVLSFPVSLIGFLPFSGVGSNYSENDPRSILIGWLFVFVVGYLQWFVLIPLVVRWVQRKFGNHDAGDSTSSPKD